MDVGITGMRGWYFLHIKKKKKEERKYDARHH